MPDITMCADCWRCPDRYECYRSEFVTPPSMRQSYAEFYAAWEKARTDACDHYWPLEGD